MFSKCHPGNRSWWWRSGSESPDVWAARKDLWQIPGHIFSQSHWIITHMLHILNIYIYLPWTWAKCKYIYIYIPYMEHMGHSGKIWENPASTMMRLQIIISFRWYPLWSFGLPFLAHLMFCISTISNHGERTPKYLGTVLTNKKSSTSSWESEAHPQPLESCESKAGGQGGIWGGVTLDAHHWSQLHKIGLFKWD